MPKRTDQDLLKKAVLKYVDCSLSSKAVANRYGLSESTLLRELRTLGIPRRQIAMPEEDKATAVRLYCLGVKITDISERIGWNLTTVREVLKSRTSWRPRVISDGDKRICVKCGKTLLSKTDFKGRTRICLTCRRAYLAAYQKTPSGKETGKKATRRHKDALLQKISNRKTGPCVDCGFAGHHIQMDFDHLDPEKKINEIAGMLARHLQWETIENEIAKCELVCANCHRLRSLILRQQHKSTATSNRPQGIRQQALRKANLQWVQKIKEDSGCSDCGFKGHGCQFDFDHRDRYTKDYAVGKIMNCSKKKIETEMAKCDIVCARCHRLRTWRQKDYTPNEPKARP